MLALLDRLRDRPLPYRLLLVFIYGLITFYAIYYLGASLFDNPLVFRIFELFWFLHIVFLTSKLHRGQSEFLALALLGLAPGIINNLLVAFTPFGAG